MHFYSQDGTTCLLIFMCLGRASLHKIVFRPLKPIRVPRNTVTVKDVDEVSILVSVVRAYDVPIRRELDKGTITTVIILSLQLLAKL